MMCGLMFSDVGMTYWGKDFEADQGLHVFGCRVDILGTILKMMVMK